MKKKLACLSACFVMLHKPLLCSIVHNLDCFPFYAATCSVKNQLALLVRMKERVDARK